MTPKTAPEGGLIMSAAQKPPGFVESSGPFEGVVPDQVAFIAPVGLFEGDRWKELQRKGIVTATQIGGQYIVLGFHPEGLVPWLPLMAQVAGYLAWMAFNGFFTGAFSLSLLAPLLCNWDWHDPIPRLAYLQFLSENRVHWYRMEVAFDLGPGQKPFTVADPTFVKIYRGTVYLPLPRKKYRTVLGKDGPRRESKGRRDSLVAIYDRGRKIQKGSFLRLEVRLEKAHLKAFDLNDLWLPFWLWLEVNLPRIARVIRRAIPGETLSTDWALLDQNHPELSRLLRLAGWKTQE